MLSSGLRCSASLSVMRYRKLWLRVKSLDFDLRAKLSSTDYNESNKTTPRPVAHIGSEKSLIELGVPKSELFNIFCSLKSLISPWVMGSIKSSTDNNEFNKPNPKSSSYRVWEIASWTWSSKKWAFFTFFTFFALLRNSVFYPKPWFPKTHHI